jgi:putative membrane protein insertion efficiency factor
MKKIVIFLVLLPLRFYKYFISPWLGSNCRFHPTCSEYCKEAIEKRGVFVGLWLSVRRILRCNPFCKSGLDPVPEKKK